MRRGLTESFFMQHPPAGGPDGFTLWGVCGLFGVRPKVILRACARGEFPPPSYSLPRCPRWSDVLAVGVDGIAGTCSVATWLPRTGAGAGTFESVLDLHG